VVPIERSTVARIGALVIAAGSGIALAVAPVPAAGAIVALLGGLWLTSLGARVVDVFLAAMAGILTGYAFFNRAFAYIGVPPLFIGEVVLVVGILALLYSLGRFRLTPVMALLLLFIGWGAAQTIPYVPRYGVDALRDAVAWMYALFAIILATTVTPQHLAVTVRVVRRVIPYLLIWLPASLLAAIALGASAPTIPGTTVPLLFAKGGDAGVILAGIAAFILVGLYARVERNPTLAEPFPWLPWLGGAAVVSIVNRGGLVAMSMVALVLLFVRQSSRWLGMFFIVALLLTVGMLVDPKVDIGGRREFSFSQLTDNVTSIFVSTGNSLEGTRSFRLRWWGEIVDYTVNGPYFWTGKGYGIALAAADGFDTTEAEELRSPHNGHIEILARSGVPGLTLWLLLHAAFAVTMFRAAMRARADGRRTWLQVTGWLFVLWAAALANATFDPYLQGPQGGIWFWSVMGLGLAAVRAVHDGAPDPWPDPDEAPPPPMTPGPSRSETTRGRRRRRLRRDDPATAGSR